MLGKGFASMIKLLLLLGLLLGLLVAISFLREKSDKIIEEKKESKTVILLAYIVRSVLICFFGLLCLIPFVAIICLIYDLIRYVMGAIF